MTLRLSFVTCAALTVTFFVGCGRESAPPAQNSPQGSSVAVSPAADPPRADAGRGAAERGDAARDEARRDDAPRVALVAKKAPPGAGPRDWNQWGGSPFRNNIPEGKNIPSSWALPKFKDDGNWTPGTGTNIRWVVKLGSQTYGNPVVANGQVYIGTNNFAGYIKKYPAEVDLGCLIAFRESDGEFLWQHSNEKLAAGRVVDWEQQGICCSPLVEGDRMWYVSSRGVVCCLDTQGFRDGENDGPFKDEPADLQTERDADVVWQFDMVAKLKLFQHNMCSCSVTCLGDLLFVCTSNGVDESHVSIPSPDCPAFICLNKKTGEFYWGDASPGLNILHGQWSSPAIATIAGVPQVMFAGGDGWLHSFRADQGKDGKPETLWACDLNPKRSKWILGGRGTRNEVISTPVVYKERIYICVGQDPEHGEGEGHLWCIDPTKKTDAGVELRRGDISPELVLDGEGKVIPHRRLQAAADGDKVSPNPNSGVAWHYSKHDHDGDGEIAFEEELHRSIGTVAIKDDILYLADFSGLFHCVDAKTGKPHWTYDMLSASWGSALIVEDKVYIGDEDGDVSVFNHSADRKKALKEFKLGDGTTEWHPINAKVGADGKMVFLNMGTSVYSTPVIANDTLFISTKTHLFAIAPPKE